MADLGKVVVTDGGNYSASVTYEKLTFVHYQGDAYMTLKTVKGVTPTDDGTNYKLFCKSAELATATKAGIVLPDGTTTTVDGNGKISVKKATTSAAGIVKPAATDFIMAADGTQKINTQFTQATELANIIAGEAIAQVWGKVSKAIATTMNLDQNALLKNMISNIAVNDPDKLNSAAYIYTLVERIGMGTELAVGANLTDGLNKVNSDFGDIKTGTYTAISNSYVSIVAGSLRKVGKLCQIYLSLNIQQNGGGYASFITLPSGFLPLELGYFDIPKCPIQVKANQLGINATATGTTALYFTYLSN